MVGLKADAPVASEERNGMLERKRSMAHGQKLIMTGVATVAACAIFYGIASKNNFFGVFGPPSPPRSKVDEARPVMAPTLSVPLAVAPVPVTSSYVECASGMRLPVGMKCPEPAPTGAQASAGAPAPASEKKGPTPEELLMARRHKGDISVATGQPNATRTAPVPVSSASGAPLPDGAANALGSSLAAISTPSVSANVIRNPSLTLSKGAMPDCTLVTAILTDQPGFLKCILSAPVMSMDGKVALLEAGTTMEGEYTQGLQAGQKAIFTLWTRAVTPNFVTVQLNSPGTDALGRAGTSGYVDNKWIERFAGAVFFSLFEDAKQFAIARDGQRAAQSAASSGGTSFNVGGQGTLSQFDNTGTTTKSIVEEMLKQGSQVKPSLYKNQGEIVRIFVARDVDFSKVYDLRPVEVD